MFHVEQMGPAQNLSVAKQPADIGNSRSRRCSTWNTGCATSWRGLHGFRLLGLKGKMFHVEHFVRSGSRPSKIASSISDWDLKCRDFSGREVRQPWSDPKATLSRRAVLDRVPRGTLSLRIARPRGRVGSLSPARSVSLQPRPKPPSQMIVSEERRNPLVDRRCSTWNTTVCHGVPCSEAGGRRPTWNVDRTSSRSRLRRSGPIHCAWPRRPWVCRIVPRGTLAQRAFKKDLPDSAP